MRACMQAPIEVGKRKLLRNTRDTIILLTPLVLWFILVLALFSVTITSQIQVRVRVWVWKCVCVNVCVCMGPIVACPPKAHVIPNVLVCYKQLPHLA
jgi:hypothetical protein